MARPRGICVTCGETFRLLKSGKVPTHTTSWNTRYTCKGSNLPPEPGRDQEETS